jgi:hypothetical protein
MENYESGEEKASRQCWECLKRRLVCDHTLPHCKKCQKAGKECPGYDERKPLQWVQPGKVTSRRRKKNSPPTIYTVPTREAPKRDLQEPRPTKVSLNPLPLAGESTKDLSARPLPESGWTSASSLTSSPESEFFECIQHQRLYTGRKPSGEDEWGYLAEDHSEKVMREVFLRNASLSDQMNALFAIGSRDEIEIILAKGLQEDAARMVGGENNPLKRLERIMFFLRMQEVPSYPYLKCETNEVVQSVKYCKLNSSVYSVLGKGLTYDRQRKDTARSAEIRRTGS